MGSIAEKRPLFAPAALVASAVVGLAGCGLDSDRQPYPLVADSMWEVEHDDPPGDTFPMSMTVDSTGNRVVIDGTCGQSFWLIAAEGADLSFRIPKELGSDNRAPQSCPARALEYRAAVERAIAGAEAWESADAGADGFRITGAGELRLVPLPTEP